MPTDNRAGMFNVLKNMMMGGQGEVNYQGEHIPTGESIQPLSSMHWKKKENKYIGIGNISDRE